MTDLLRVGGLTAGYGPVEVLHGLDFTVGSSEIVVMLGANGAGKTTTMRAVSGTIPRRGTITFDGHDISRTGADAILKRGVAHVPQGRGTFADLTVEDNLKVGAITRKDGKIGADIDRWLTTFPRLEERRTQKAGSLSGGEAQMLAVARAVMSRPRLLLCDEPSLGLAPLVTQELFRILDALNKEEGMAILLVEQNLGVATEVAERQLVMIAGRIAAETSSTALAADPDLQRRYLGVEPLAQTV